MKLYLNGGGDGEKLKEIYDIFTDEIGNDKPLLYVPLAMNEKDHTYDECYEWIKKELPKINKIEMVRSYDELANKNYNDYSAIFIGGGNTFSLLNGLKESGSFEKINNYIKEGGIIFGGSAGAIIFGYDINSILIMDSNDVKLEDTKGFDVLEGKSIFCHYTNEWTLEGHEKFKNYLIEYTKFKEEVYALPEEDTIIIDNNETIFVGSKPYYEFINGEEIKHEIM